MKHAEPRLWASVPLRFSSDLWPLIFAVCTWSVAVLVAELGTLGNVLRPAVEHRPTVPRRCVKLTSQGGDGLSPDDAATAARKAVSLAAQACMP